MKERMNGFAGKSQNLVMMDKRGLERELLPQLGNRRSSQKTFKLSNALQPIDFRSRRGSSLMDYGENKNIESEKLNGAFAKLLKPVDNLTNIAGIVSSFHTVSP